MEQQIQDKWILGGDMQSYPAMITSFQDDAAALLQEIAVNSVTCWTSRSDCRPGGASKETSHSM
jgi:hypothetical protein